MYNEGRPRCDPSKEGLPLETQVCETRAVSVYAANRTFYNSEALNIERFEARCLSSLPDQ